MEEERWPGIPVYLDHGDPQIDDPSVEWTESMWQPACGLTEKLVRCLEGVRDVKAAIGPLVFSPDPDKDKRQLKQTVVPIFNLAIALRDLYNDLQSKGWPNILPEERKKATERYAVFQSRVNTRSGPLKTARDKIGAHVDKDAVRSGRDIWRGVTTLAALEWIRASLELFMPMLTADVFSWRRESGHPDVTRIMNVDSKEVFLHSSKKDGLSLLQVTITASPKFGIEREAVELAVGCQIIEQNLRTSQKS